MAEYEKSKGVGLSLDLCIGSLNDAVTTLANALRDETEKGRQTVAEWIDKVYNYAKDIRESWGGEEGREGATPDVRQAYDRAVSTLRDAARNGQARAADALKRLGEALEPEEEAVGAGSHKAAGKSGAHKGGKRH